MALTTTVNVKIEAAILNALDLGSTSSSAVFNFLRQMADGAGAHQANKVFQDQRTLTTGQTEDLDLNGGGLLDPLGAVLVFTTVKLLAIFSLPTNTTNLTLLGDANSVPILSAAATTVPSIQPGGAFIYFNPGADGAVVTAATGDIIQVANSAGASAVYNILIVGD